MKGAVGAFLSKPFIRFAIAGAIASAANILSRVALSLVLSFSASIVVAFLIGMTVAYILMRLLVFERSGRKVSQEYIRFVLVNLLALAQVWCISMGLTELVFPRMGNVPYPETVAHVIGVLSPIVTSYFLHKYFTFAGDK